MGNNITIAGGVVTATGSENGAGIGGGSWGNASGITVSGGYILATADTSTDIIGAGYNGSSSNITIVGGCFGEGSISEGTVYDTSVYAGYYVRDNEDTETKAKYPYEVAQEMYIVTIPAEVEIGGSTTVSIDDVQLPADEYVNLAITGTSDGEKP